MRIDLNCDMGESFGVYRIGADEDAMLELVTSANVACGFHAGDPRIIDRTVGLAAKHGVGVGAHPSHHDLRGFGRRAVAASPDEVEADIILMAKNGVDGVYSDDPRRNPQATKFDTLTFLEAINLRLQVMDSTALSLCLDNDMPIVVFNVQSPGEIERIILGERVGTIVY